MASWSASDGILKFTELSSFTEFTEIFDANAKLNDICFHPDQSLVAIAILKTDLISQEEGNLGQAKNFIYTHLLKKPATMMDQRLSNYVNKLNKEKK